MNIIIDTSSLIWRCLLVGEDKEHGYKMEHEGNKVQVNGAGYGIENAVTSLCALLREINATPKECIFVLEGEHSTARRKIMLPTYKEGRGNRPQVLNDNFGEAQAAVLKMFQEVGAQVAWCRGCEADDTIGFLAQKLPGQTIVVSEDGDLCVLLSERVQQWKAGALVSENPLGPFPPRFITLFKALVGDTSDKIKGCPGFGDKAWMDFLVWGGDAGLAALDAMVRRQTLHDLEDDVAEFKPLRKVIDGAQAVYTCYDVASLHPEWVDTERNPLEVVAGTSTPATLIKDERLRKWAGPAGSVPVTWFDTLHPPKVKVIKQHAIFDIELIGLERPVFLVCTKIVETGEFDSFWLHKPEDMTRLAAMLAREDLTWVGFNSQNFDVPLLGAALDGKDVHTLKRMATAIVNDDTLGYWQLPKIYEYAPLEIDHIDLFQTAPGVNISLKTFAGRLGYPTMVDLPYHHDKDLTDDEMVVLERYCRNDLGVTEALFQALRNEIDLRVEMGEECGIDLRSKSDAQVAEAILKKAAGIGNKKGEIPSFVKYKASAFVKTDNPILLDLIAKLEDHSFKINYANGQVIAPDFLKDPIKLGWNAYQFGVGGLHSTLDKRLYLEADDEYELSDFDVASYYPNIMLKAGLTPRLEGGAGERFVEEYRKIYEKRMEAKRAGNKKVANALKISLNGTFGKLGNVYCPFYSPDLMLAVTVGGQLNLACIIAELEKISGVFVASANTDGILVSYPKSARQAVLDVFLENAVRTGFIYEETPYSKVAMKDVNNYINVTGARRAVIVSQDEGVVETPCAGGKVKRKGLYAETSLMKNPTFEICSNLAAEYLCEGIHPRDAILGRKDIKDFVAVRVVKGGAIQYDRFVEVDDWVLVKDAGSKDNEWMRQEWLDGLVERAPVKRKSRPPSVQIGVGGESCGRVARWYVSKSSSMPINYVTSGNRVPKTEGARMCMTMPEALPEDVDVNWYVHEALTILSDIGVDL